MQILNKPIKKKISYKDVDHDKIRTLSPLIRHISNNPLCMCDVCMQSRYPDAKWINLDDIDFSGKTVKEDMRKKLNNVYSDTIKALDNLEKENKYV